MADNNNQICVYLQICKTERTLGLVYSHCLRPAGISGKQFAMLMHVHAKKATFITDTARALAIDQTTATRNVRILEKKGYLTGFADRLDARKKKIMLTASGLRKIDECLPLWQKAQDLVRDLLGDSSLKMMMGLLHKIEEY